jgi:hypothetical protein
VELCVNVVRLQALHIAFLRTYNPMVPTDELKRILREMKGELTIQEIVLIDRYIKIVSRYDTKPIRRKSLIFKGLFQQQ